MLVHKQDERWLIWQRNREIAAFMLNAMIASAPIADRTKINKKKWASIAWDWAEVLHKENIKRAPKPKGKK